MTLISQSWEFDVERGPDWLFVRVSSPRGKLRSAAGFADQVMHLLEQTFSHRLVLEFDSRTTLSVDLLKQLVELSQRIEACDGMLHFAGLTERNLDALRLARLDQHFHCFGNRQEAVMCRWGSDSQRAAV